MFEHLESERQLNLSVYETSSSSVFFHRCPTLTVLPWSTYAPNPKNSIRNLSLGRKPRGNRLIPQRVDILCTGRIVQIATNLVATRTSRGLLKSRPPSALWGLLDDFKFIPVALANSAMLLARRAKTSVAEVVRPRSDVAQTPEPRRGDTYADDSSLCRPAGARLVFAGQSPVPHGTG